jgi:hypothetical protein
MTAYNRQRSSSDISSLAFGRRDRKRIFPKKLGFIHQPGPVLCADLIERLRADVRARIFVAEDGPSGRVRDPDLITSATRLVI